jgi:tetratricopeptide (TPR) repeat protein
MRMFDTDARKWGAMGLLLVLFVVAAYVPGLRGGFIFDDYPNLIDNARVKLEHFTANGLTSAMFSSEAGTLQRPIAMLTFALNYWFTGFDGAAMKWTNIIIHAINALLVFGLVRLVVVLGAPATSPTLRRWTAGFAAAAWALQPINFFGVLYIVQRMESLSHLFVFGGLWLYLVGRQRQLRGESGRWPMGIGLLGGTALAILCKESGVLLPLYAWLMELCLPALRNAPDRRRVQVLFAAVLWLPCVAGLAWLAPYVLRPETFASRDFTLVERLLTEPRVVFDYLQWTLLPRLAEFGLFHDDYVVSRGWLSPATTVVAIAGIVALAAFAWWLRNKRPIAALGLLWFLAAQALTATVIPLELVYEHRNYFASLGVCLVLADLLLLLPKQESARRIGVLVAGLAVLYYGAITHLRAREWSEPLRFASIEASKHPNSPRATYGYGRMLVIASNYEPNSPHLKPAIAALEHAASLPKSGLLPHSALLLTAAHTHTPVPDAWWNDMNARLRANPVGPQEINAISSVVRCSRDSECRFPPERMLALFEAAVAREPVADIYALWGDYTLNVLRRPQDAIELSKRSVELRPTVAQYHVNLAMQLIYVGRIEEARREIATLRELGRLGQNEAAAAMLEQRIADRADDPT